MTTAAKTYLNVPYAQKDAAKALGARWDAANKKWYVPAGKDLEPFGQWLASAQAGAAETGSVAPVSALAPNITQPADSNFVAYDGDEPPWD
ncbi:DUF5710 domain-containing protein [Methylomonas sp. EFPC3]|uniref:DUF5710 domain-containing protein n=1 Tax=Methylomonas TaxID=416 RepID=UPI001127A6C8|nr:MULTISPECIES: DUF5710 domain-containing protein [Methylomonas]TPQ26294.1 hypothetical protein C2U68_12155 [Methylomonas koyamae]WFP49657.1 DUF5710 domain-containing protein [Methylomonas sp. EFPC3]